MNNLLLFSAILCFIYLLFSFQILNYFSFIILFLFHQIQFQHQRLANDYFHIAIALNSLRTFHSSYFSIFFHQTIEKISIIFTKIHSKKLKTWIKQTFSFKDFFSKCNKIHKNLQSWSHLLKNSLIKKFNFCTVKDV